MDTAIVSYNRIGMPCFGWTAVIDPRVNAVISGIAFAPNELAARLLIYSHLNLKYDFKKMANDSYYSHLNGHKTIDEILDAIDLEIKELNMTESFHVTKDYDG